MIARLKFFGMVLVVVACAFWLALRPAVIKVPITGFDDSWDCPPTSTASALVCHKKIN